VFRAGPAATVIALVCKLLPMPGDHNANLELAKSTHPSSRHPASRGIRVRRLDATVERRRDRWRCRVRWHVVFDIQRDRGRWDVVFDILRDHGRRISWTDHRNGRRGREPGPGRCSWQPDLRSWAGVGNLRSTELPSWIVLRHARSAPLALSAAMPVAASASPPERACPATGEACAKSMTNV